MAAEKKPKERKISVGVRSMLPSLICLSSEAAYDDGFSSPPPRQLFHKSGGQLHAHAVGINSKKRRQHGRRSAAVTKQHLVIGEGEGIVGTKKKDSSFLGGRGGGEPPQQPSTKSPSTLGNGRRSLAIKVQRSEKPKQLLTSFQNLPPFL